MRLIGGNISDTPVKEVGDGSAFNVGGAAAAPALLTLGTPGSATAISQTGWATVFSRPDAWLLYGYGFKWLQVGDQKLSCTFRHDGGAMYGGVIDLDSNGHVATVNTATALTIFDTIKTPVAAKLVPGTYDNSPRIVVATSTRVSPREFQIGVYDLSDSYTIHGAVIEKAGAADVNPIVEGLEVCLTGPDYGILFAKSDNIVSSATPFKFTTTQSIGSDVNTDGMPWGTGETMSFAYESEATHGKVYNIGGNGRGTEWDLTEDTTPTLALTSYINASSTSVGAMAHIHGVSTHFGCLVRPPVASADQDGAFMLVSYAGLRHWPGKRGTNEIAWDGNNPFNVGTFIPPGAQLYNQHNFTFVQVDTDGDWVRGVTVGPYGTTGLQLIPINVNPLTGEFVRGTTATTTTNISPHRETTLNFFAGYQGIGDSTHILIFCEDTAAAPSYLEVPVTIT